MSPAVTGRLVAPVDLVGRDAEREALERLLDGVGAGVAGLICGEAGIGKTALLNTVVRHAVGHCHVLRASPVESETQMSFCGLRDMFAGLPPERIACLPAPQRNALEVALLLAEPGGSVPERRAVGTAVVSVLGRLTEVSPVLVAIDDVQHLDSATADVLAFAFRRASAGLVVLATAPPGGSEDDPLLATLVHDMDLLRVDLDPLDPEAIARIIGDRLGWVPSRPSLLTIHAASRGNPFVAVELARAERSGEPLPSVSAAIDRRLDSVSPPVRHLLLGTALEPYPDRTLLETLAAGLDLDPEISAEAFDSGILRGDGKRVDFDHPLLRLAIISRSTDTERRDMHRLLAGFATHEEQRARHLAAATPVPDAGVAAGLETAAVRARAGGSALAAAELAEQSRRLTPPSDREAVLARTIEAARHVFAAGDGARARSLLEDAAGLAPPGPLRAAAYLELGLLHHRTDGYGSAIESYRAGLDEPGLPTGLAGDLHRELAFALMFSGQRTLAAEQCDAAVRLAEQSGDATRRRKADLPRLTLAFADGDLADFEATGIDTTLDDSDTPLEQRWAYVRAVALIRTDRLYEAHSELQSLMADAAERGEESARPRLLAHLSDVELQLGRTQKALELAGEGLELARQTGQRVREVTLLRVIAMGHAIKGDTEKAVGHAVESEELATSVASLPAYVQARSVRGFVALSDGRYEEAWECLASVAEAVSRVGVREPSLSRWLPDAVETLICLGQLDEAERLVTPFRTRAAQLGRPWAEFTADRCLALLAGAQGRPRAGLRRIEAALTRQDMLEPFERGRALLCAGMLQRRVKAWRQADTRFREALAIFDQVGARVWAGITQGELATLEGSARTAGLTATQLRVAELASEGRTNKQIAASLQKSVKTVEAHLSQVYRALDITRRGEIAGRLAALRDPRV